MEIRIISSSGVEKASPHAMYRAAKAVGYMFNPFIFPPLLAALVLAHFGAPAAEILGISTLFLVFFGLIPLGYIFWLLRQRRIDSLEIANRVHRRAPLMVSLGTHVAAILVVPALGSTIPRILAVLIGCQLANTAVIAMITERWKISIHAATAASFVSILFFFALAGLSRQAGAAVPGLLQPYGVLVITPLIPLLMWARIRVRVHTLAETVAGAALGAVLSAAELVALDALGVLAL